MDRACPLEPSLADASKETIVVSFGNDVACLVQHTISSPIRSYNIYWPYEANSTSYQVCLTNDALSYERLRLDISTKSGYKVLQARLFLWHGQYWTVDQGWYYGCLNIRGSASRAVMQFDYNWHPSFGWLLNQRWWLDGRDPDFGLLTKSQVAWEYACIQFHTYYQYTTIAGWLRQSRPH